MEPMQYKAVWVAHIMAYVALILVLVWALAYQDNDYFLGGLGWSGSPLFNWHPVLMVAGLVTAYTEGPLTIDLSLEYHGTVRTVPICILSYRTPMNLSRESRKRLHSFFQLLAVVLVSLGLWAVFEYHNEELYANLYSMHSWSGIVVVTLLYANYVGGFFSFFLGCTSQSVKAQYMPRHVFIGIFTYFAAAFTCLLGIQDKNSALGCGLDVSLTSPEYNEAAYYWNLYAGCRVSNGLGIVIIVTCLCATYAVMNTKQQVVDSAALARPLL